MNTLMSLSSSVQLVKSKGNTLDPHADLTLNVMPISGGVPTSVSVTLSVRDLADFITELKGIHAFLRGRRFTAFLQDVATFNKGN